MPHYLCPSCHSASFQVTFGRGVVLLRCWNCGRTQGFPLKSLVKADLRREIASEERILSKVFGNNVESTGSSHSSLSDLL